MREIRNLFRFIPFGKFSLSGRGTPPYNQVYVGRQRERAEFIELLTHQEQFGAFLVSGQRGAGKTSFVEYCLSEYKKMAFQRSIRTTRTSPLIENIFLLILGSLAIFLFTLLTQFLELASQNALESVVSDFHPNRNQLVTNFASTAVIWIWAPFLALSFICLFPLLLAWRSVRSLSILGRTRGQQSYYRWGAILSICIAAFFWLLLPGFLELTDRIFILDKLNLKSYLESFLNLKINQILGMAAFFALSLVLIGEFTHQLTLRFVSDYQKSSTYRSKPFLLFIFASIALSLFDPKPQTQQSITINAIFDFLLYFKNYPNDFGEFFWLYFLLCFWISKKQMQDYFMFDRRRKYTILLSSVFWFPILILVGCILYKFNGKDGLYFNYDLQVLLLPVMFVFAFYALGLLITTGNKREETNFEKKIRWLQKKFRWRLKKSKFKKYSAFCSYLTLSISFLVFLVFVSSSVFLVFAVAFIFVVCGYLIYLRACLKSS